MQQTTFAARVGFSGRVGQMFYIAVLEAGSTRVRMFPSGFARLVEERYPDIRWITGPRLTIERNCREMPELREVCLADMAASV